MCERRRGFIRSINLDDLQAIGCSLVGERRGDFEMNVVQRFLSARHACGVTGLSGHGIFEVWPDLRRLEAQQDVAFGDACVFQAFGELA